MTATRNPGRPCSDHFVGSEDLTCHECGWIAPMGQYRDEIMAGDEYAAEASTTHDPSPPCAATATSAPYATVAPASTVLDVVSDAAEVVGSVSSPSARVCLFEAWRALDGVGDGLGAVRWALRALEHAVGIFHPAYVRAVGSAVDLFPAAGLDRFGVLIGGPR